MPGFSIRRDPSGEAYVDAENDVEVKVCQEFEPHNAVVNGQKMMITRKDGMRAVYMVGLPLPFPVGGLPSMGSMGMMGGVPIMGHPAMLAGAPAILGRSVMGALPVAGGYPGGVVINAGNNAQIDFGGRKRSDRKKSGCCCQM